MSAQQEHELNNRAYRELKHSIDGSYPAGRYVALVHGKVAASAATLPELLVKLDRIEKDPDRHFVIQAGVHYPEYEIIRQLHGS